MEIKLKRLRGLKEKCLWYLWLCAERYKANIGRFICSWLRAVEEMDSLKQPCMTSLLIGTHKKHQKAIFCKNNNLTLTYSTFKSLDFWREREEIIVMKHSSERVGSQVMLQNYLIKYPDVTEYSPVLVCLNAGQVLICLSLITPSVTFSLSWEGADSRKDLLFSKHEDRGSSGKISFQLWASRSWFQIQD